MKRDFKTIILFIIILFFWSLSGLIFKVNQDYYSYLTLPKFILSNKLISILWFVVYILNSISIIIITKKVNIFKNYDYLYILITSL